MAIGVEFLLKATTDGFTSAVGKAEASIKGVKNELKSFGGGNLAGLIGIGGIVAGFKATLDHAQSMRAECEKLGMPLDDATRRVARVADGFDAVKAGVMGAATAIIGRFAEAGETLGQWYKEMRGVSEAQQNTFLQIAKNADEAEARLKKSREENSPEKVMAAEAKLATFRRDQDFARADAEGKIALLISEQTALKEKQNAVGAKTTEYLNLQLEIEKKGAEAEKLKTDAATAFQKAAADVFKVEQGSTEFIEANAAGYATMADNAERVADAVARRAELEDAQTIRTGAMTGYSGGNGVGDLTAEAHRLAGLIKDADKNPETRNLIPGLKAQLDAVTTRYNAGTDPRGRPDSNYLLQNQAASYYFNGARIPGQAAGEDTLNNLSQSELLGRLNSDRALAGSLDSSRFSTGVAEVASGFLHRDAAIAVLNKEVVNILKVLDGRLRKVTG